MFRKLKYKKNWLIANDDDDDEDDMINIDHDQCTPQMQKKYVPILLRQNGQRHIVYRALKESYLFPNDWLNHIDINKTTLNWRCYDFIRCII